MVLHRGVTPSANTEAATLSPPEAGVPLPPEAIPLHWALHPEPGAPPEAIPLHPVLLLAIAICGIVAGSEEYAARDKLCQL